MVLHGRCREARVPSQACRCSTVIAAGQRLESGERQSPSLGRIAFPWGGNAFPWGGNAFPWRGIAFPWGGNAFPWGGNAFPWRGIAFPWGGIAFPWGGNAFPWSAIARIIDQHITDTHSPNEPRTTHSVSSPSHENAPCIAHNVGPPRAKRAATRSETRPTQRG